MALRLLGFVFAAALATALLAAPARAQLIGGVGSVQAADSDGVPSDSFATNEYLFANVRAGLRGGRICVLPAIFYDDVEDNELTCGENEDALGADPSYAAWTTPNEVAGIGELRIMPIEAPPLKQPELEAEREDGDYFILGDQGQVAAQDLCCDVASQIFSVRDCEADCDTKIGEDAAKEYKDAAKAIAYPEVNGRVLADKLECKATGAVLMGATVYGGFVALSGLGYAVVGSTVSVVGVGGFGLWAATAVVGVETTAVMAALAINHFISCRRAEMWEDIANDPPDYAFAEIVQPGFTDFPPLGDPLADAIAVTGDKITAYGKAQLTSYERYQGALEQDDRAAASRQAAATSRYGLMMVRAIRQHTAQMRKLAADHPEMADPLLTETARQAVAPAYDRVRESGFNPEERQRLIELGLDDAAIEAVRESFDDHDVRDAPVDLTLAQLAEEAADGWDEVIPGLLSFSRQAGFVAENTAPPEPGSIVIRQETVPAGGGKRFEYSAPGGSFSLADGETHSLQLAPGQVPVSTVVDAGDHLVTAVTCDDQGSADPSEASPSSGSATVHLEPGEKVTCTFTHTRKATVVVKAVTQPADATGLRLGYVLGAAPWSFDLGHGEQAELALAPGEHVVEQRSARGVELGAIECDDDASAAPSTVDVVGSAATVRAEPGERVTCTFRSARTEGRLIVETTSTPSDPRGAVAQATASFGGFSAYTGSPTEIDLAAGPATLDFAPLDGARVDGLECDGTAFEGGRADLTIAAGAITRCKLSMVHDQPGRLVVAHVVDAAVIDPAHERSYRGDPPFGDVKLKSGETTSRWVWPSGTYTVTAAPDSDYRPAAVACDDGASAQPSAADLAGLRIDAAVEPGEVVRCTFTWRPLTMVSRGPLRRVRSTPDLACAVQHVLDERPSFFGDTACGTFVRAGETTFGPSVPAGPSVTTYTLVSQTEPEGAGTRGNPLRVVTEVDAGDTGLRIRQVDRYVVGEEAYKTSVQVTNTGAAPREGQLYRAADCFLQDSDAGYGDLDPETGAVACRSATFDEHGATARGDRIEQWFPLTPGSRRLQANYSMVWGYVSGGMPFDDTCLCDAFLDNGAGLNWPYSLAPGESATFEHLTTFSPLGREPLLVAARAQPSTVVAGGRVEYEVEIGNGNATDVAVEGVTFTLPPGFSYVAGSAQGAGEPAVSGRVLTFPAAGTAAAGGVRTVRFAALAALQPGAYDGEAAADPADPFAAVPTGPTARVTVTPDETPPAVDLRTPPEGARYDRGAVVKADFSCADADTGIATCIGTAADGAAVDTAAAGAHAFEVTATDRAGNKTTVRHRYDVTAPPESTPTPTPTPTAVPEKPKVEVKGEQAVSLGLPASNRCVSRRRFPIRLRAPKGAKLKSARVWLDGKRVKVTRKRGRLTAMIDLRGMRKGRFAVLVRAVTADGRQVRDKRRYRTCAKRKSRR